MPIDRRSPVFVGTIVGCIAGVVAFLAMHQDANSALYAPSSTTQVAAVSSVAVPQYRSVAAQPEMVTAEVNDKEVVAPVEYQTPAQEGGWSGLMIGAIAAPLAVAAGFFLKKRNAEEERRNLVSIDDLLSAGKQAMVASAVIGASASMTDVASAYPIFAQQGFANPREATGRIVCANCHLASKPTEIEMPQSVLPDQVFEAVSKVPYMVSAAPSVVDPSSVVGSVTFQQGQPVQFVQEAGVPVSQALVEMDVPSTPGTVFKATIKVPFDPSLKQVGAKGKLADLNVGAVIVLPEGFKLAPADRIPEKLKEEIKGLQFIQYSADQPNVLVAGPVPGKTYEEMTLALLSPDPNTNRNVHYGTLPVYVGANRGRGQLYPTGEKTNNSTYEVVHSGKIADIELDAKRRVYTIAISEPNGLVTNEELPAGAELIVKKGDVVEAGQTITTNPNVGGFGQSETEIVLQDPFRVQSFLFFSFTVLATQTMLVVKKKQYEQVQLSEMNF